MGFWSALFQSRNKPQNATQGSGYRFFLGQTTSGKAVWLAEEINRLKEEKQTTQTSIIK